MENGSVSGFLTGVREDDGANGGNEYQIEIDINDGTRTHTETVYGPNDDIDVWVTGLPLGENTLKVRVTEVDIATGNLLASVWKTITFTANNTPPTWTGGTTIPASPSGATTSFAFSILENRTGTVGTLAATDPDLGDFVRYESLDDTSGAVQLDSITGVLSVGYALNYESFMLAKAPPFINFTVKAYDSNGGFVLADVSVEILDKFNEAFLDFTADQPSHSASAFAPTIPGGLAAVPYGVAVVTPEIIAQQHYGRYPITDQQELNTGEWSQPPIAGSGWFSAGMNTVSSSVTITAQSGNVCNSVNYIPNDPTDSGTLDLYAAGIGAGTYTFIFEVTTTLTAAGANARAFAKIESADVRPVNGMSVSGGTAGPVTVTFTDWCSQTVTITSASDRPRLIRWVPTISFSLAGTGTATGVIRVAEIRQDY